MEPEKQECIMPLMQRLSVPVIDVVAIGVYHSVLLGDTGYHQACPRAHPVVDGTLGGRNKRVLLFFPLSRIV